MIKFLLHGTQTRFDVPQRLAVCYLGKNHAEVLIETRETFYAMVAVISSDTLVELLLGKKVYQLRENSLPGIHQPVLSINQRKYIGQDLRAS